MNERTRSVTYLALGDSLTEGVGAEGPDRHFVAQLFDHLRRTQQCRMQNMGISGLTSTELYELLQTPAMIKLVPRVSHITITTGGCDFIDWFEQGARVTSLIQTMQRIRYRADKILEHVRRNNPAATVQMMGFYLPVPAYELGFAFASRTVRTMNLSYAQLCRKYGAGLVNPFDSFLHRKDYFADEVHPNQRGYDELTRLFQQPAAATESAEPVPVDPASSPEGSLC